MKSLFIYFFILTFIFSFGYLEQHDSISEVNQIEKLLNERIKIINDFLYADKDIEALEKLEKELSNIEDARLLKADMDTLTRIYYNPTDYERTTRVKIKQVKEINVSEDMIEMLANLEWTILENGDLAIESSFMKDYNISCVFKNKKLYLTNMEFVE